MLIFLFVWLMVFFVILFIGALMAPFAINKLKLQESGYSGRNYIYNLPEMFMKSWYEPHKLYVRNMVVYGLLGSILGFSVLFIASKFGLV
jgi:hypothetical protein